MKGTQLAIEQEKTKKLEGEIVEKEVEIKDLKTENTGLKDKLSTERERRQEHQESGTRTQNQLTSAL